MDKAIDYFNKVLDTDPYFHKARYNIIEVYVSQSNFKLAKEHIDFLVNMDNENLKVKKLHAFVLYSEGDLEEALELYKEIIFLGDYSYDVRLNIVKLKYQLGLFEKALMDVNDLLLEFEDKELYYISAKIAESANELELASSYYESYIGLGDFDVAVLLDISNIYEKQEDFENLKRILNKLIDMSEDTNDNNYRSDALLQLATIAFLVDNDFSRGYDYLQDAINYGLLSEDKALKLLEEPDLIEKDKIRQLFVDNEIIEDIILE